MSNVENNVAVQKPVPPEIAGKFNWGAFLVNWIWGLGNNTYLPLIIIPVSFIPVLGSIASLGLAIWFGTKGNEWAWQNKQWESVEHFTRVQQLWVRWYLYIVGGVFVLTIIGMILALVFGGAQG